MIYNIIKLIYNTFLAKKSDGAVNMKILSIGVNWRESADFVTDRDLLQNDYSFIFFKSPAIVRLNGKETEIEGGQGILFNSSQRQYYRACENAEFMHDFINLHAETDEEKNLADGMPCFMPFVCYSPYRITESIEDIIRETHTPYTECKWEIISLMCRTFLLRLKNEIALKDAGIKKGVHYEKLCRLRDDIYSRPKEDWTVESMSAEVHLSASYFQRLYKYFFSETCANDVINARISAAKNMLKYSGMKIGSIAEECGYKNAEHFIRQFGKYAGMSPNKYRNSHK